MRGATSQPVRYRLLPLSRGAVIPSFQFRERSHRLSIAKSSGASNDSPQIEDILHLHILGTMSRRRLDFLLPVAPEDWSV